MLSSHIFDYYPCINPLEIQNIFKMTTNICVSESRVHHSCFRWKFLKMRFKNKITTKKVHNVKKYILFLHSVKTESERVS